VSGVGFRVSGKEGKDYRLKKMTEHSDIRKYSIFNLGELL
jgi:hypothetical protein